MPARPTLSTPRRPAVLTLALLGLLVFTAGVGRKAVVGVHEARVVETSVTMLRSGPPWAAQFVVAAVPQELAAVGNQKFHPWLVPIYQAAVRLQKPPLPYWTSAAGMWLFGERPLAVRLAPALLGALGTLLIADLARRLYGRRYFLPTGLAWASSYFVIDGYREITADPFLAGLSLVALWAFVVACRSRRGQESPADDCDERGAAHWRLLTPFLLFYAALALGAMAKGPAVFLHVLLPAALLAWTHRLRPRQSLWAHGVGVVVFLLIALPWPLLVWWRVPGALELWRFESVGRLLDNEHKPAAWWFYGPVLLGNSLPWTPLWLLAVAGVAATWRSLRGPWTSARRWWLPVLWMIAVVLVFSLMSNKKAAYLLPLMPAVVLLSGRGLVVLASLHRRRVKAAGALRLAQALLGLGFAAVVAVLIVTARAPGATRTVDLAERVVLACVVVGFAVLPLRRLKTGPWRMAQALAYALAITLLLAGPDAIKSNRKPLRAFQASDDVTHSTSVRTPKPVAPLAYSGVSFSVSAGPAMSR